jgi:dihydroorotase
VLGGVTAVFEMPNTDPLTTTAQALADKVKRAHHRMHCDFAFYVGATRENTPELGALERLPGVCAVKVFMGSSTGSLLIEDDDGVRAVLRSINRRAAFHSEDEYRLRERVNLRVAGDPATHPVWRDATAALTATQRLVWLARETGKRVHVLHVTSKEEAAFLGAHKDVASAEATSAHLTLAAPDCYAKLGTLAQLNPPIRDAAHRDGIWRGVAQGVIDTIGSDHSPHTRAEKAQGYPQSPSGMPGVQTLVPLMLDHVNAGRLTLARFVDLTSAGPARIFNIAAKGRIAAGYDADITIIDLKRRETISDRWIASRAGWTPYNGISVTGWPIGTFVRGRKVMWDGDLVQAGKGERIRFLETLGAA